MMLDKTQPHYWHGIEDCFALADLPQYESIWSISRGTGWWELDQIFRIYPSQFCLVHGATNHGKALALDTKVPTASGWSTMGELEVGDTVFDEMGRPCRVTKTSVVMYGRECYRLRFSCGAEVVADAQHQWLTTRRWRMFSAIETTKDIAFSLRIGKKKRANHRIALCHAIDGAEFIAPVDPYSLGVWLGDGNSENGGITCFDNEIVCRLAANGEDILQQSTVGRFTIKNLKVRLRLLGVLENKHIPTAYQRASIKQRVMLLRGLMDTDGSCRERDRVCEYISVNERLARDVFQLVCGLGIKATFLTGNATINGRVASKKYRVCFVAPFAVFTLSRKLARQKLANSLRSSSRHIVECERIDTVPVKCIQVDSPSSLFLVTKSFIPTHNSTFLMNLIVQQWDQFQMKSWVYMPENQRHIRDRLSLIWGDRQNWDQFAELGVVFGNAERDWRKNQPRDLNWILGKAYECIQEGHKGLIFCDPWNEIEFSKPRDMPMTDFIGECLKGITGFCRDTGITLFLTAHPTKAGVSDGKIPGPYDIDGSANWANKPDNILCVYRERDGKTTKVICQKAREIGSGKRGGWAVFDVGEETGVFAPQHGAVST